MAPKRDVQAWRAGAWAGDGSGRRVMWILGVVVVFSLLTGLERVVKGGETAASSVVIGGMDEMVDISGGVCKRCVL